jgi:hypothetical protein
MSASHEAVNNAFEQLDANVADFEEAQRKRYFAGFKERRQHVSDDELMFESLADLFRWDAEERAFMHLILARSLGKSPDQKLIINEVDLGRQLPGDDDVTDESFKKRCYRSFNRVDERQRIAGRMVLERIPGKRIVGERKETGTNKRFASRTVTFVGAEYRVWLPQAIVEGVSMAIRLRAGKRRDRFRQAALAIFESEFFPTCEPKPQPAQETPFVQEHGDAEIGVDPAETHERLTGEPLPPGATKSAQGQGSHAREPRALRRFTKNAALALSRAKEDGEAKFNRQAATLYVTLTREVERAQGGDPSDTEKAIRQTIELLQSLLDSPADLSCIEASASVDAKDIQDSTDDPDDDPDLVPRGSGQKPQKAQQNRNFDPQGLDTGVQKNAGGGRLSDDFIAEVRDRADIVRVVSERVKLKHAGQNYIGCCPFHDDRTPSFHVTPSKGLYYCFGCRAGGDVFKFIRETEGVGFRDAVRIVAESSGVGWQEEYNRRTAA